jgi:YVTN family beta-propeller protein
MVYVSQIFSNDVYVIDGQTNQVVAVVPVGNEPRGVAVNVPTNRIYVANTSSASVSIIDGETNEVLQVLEVGIHPRGIDAYAERERVYAAYGPYQLAVIATLDVR